VSSYLIRRIILRELKNRAGICGTIVEMFQPTKIVKKMGSSFAAPRGQRGGLNEVGFIIIKHW
jgi:hypothetical protein